MVAKAARRAQGKKLAGKKRQPVSDEPKRAKKSKADSKPGKRKAEGGHQPPSKKPKTKSVGGKRSAASLSSGKDDATVKAAEKAASKVAKNPKVERKIQLKSAVTIWETLRRHDTAKGERDALIKTITDQVKGRVVAVATSPKGSRVLQACAKYGTAEQRKAILAELRPELIELSKSPYAHFLICKLIATAPKEDLPGLLSAYKGHVATLLRHPSGAAVVDELYNVCTAAQRNHLAAEFYGKEYSLLTQESAPAHLQELLATADGVKRRAILQRMALHLLPISEKAIVDPALTHRLVAEFLQCAAPMARQEIVDNLAGEPLLRMVHTRDGALAAALVLSFAGAKDCKKFIKAMKGHVETMAKDRWGSLVLASALSNVDDTVLMRKIILPTFRDKAEELMQDKHARSVVLQLLAPDKPRYLQPELQSIVSPELDDGALSVAKAAGEDQEEEEAGQAPAGQRKKPAKQRRVELLGEGEGSLGASLLSAAAGNVADLLRSANASDVLVELALGATEGALLESHAEAVEALQTAIVDALAAPVDEGEGNIVDDIYVSRALRRLVLAADDGDYSAATVKRIGKLLRPVFDSNKRLREGHGKKVVDALAKKMSK